ncbi:MAG TPA: hypothetical protein VGN57_08865 [Pirellulaceae bacterium]|jgi:hypothetical protein|nr:hypothetical protein [Pirellulaceae bacterium]
MPNYSPALDAWIDLEKLPELGPGHPAPGFAAELRDTTNEELIRPHAVKDRSFANLCRSALLLHHDCLDESHEISQEEGSATGSYLHGVMHRREPDFGNAKYWFRRVGKHSIESDLFSRARRIAAEPEFSKESLLRSFSAKPVWDALAFVDLCERGYRDGGPAEDYARQVAREEWRLLFDDCFRRAIGEKGAEG